jgi:membrane protein
MFGVLVAESVISKPVHAAGGPVAQGLVIYAGTAVFFWWTMHFLPAGRVPWRRLIHAAILTALFWIGLELFSSAYFSPAITSDSRLYGTIGVVFALLTWFIGIGAVIVLGQWVAQPGTSERPLQDRIIRPCPQWIPLPPELPATWTR